MRKILCFLVCLVALSCSVAFASGAEPKETQLDEKYLLGLYKGNGELLLVRENDGRLNILYRYLEEDHDYRQSNVFPLKKERYDVYAIREAGALTSTEGTVRFERDKEGYGISCNVGGNRYTRVFFDAEKEEPFKVEVIKPLTELRQEIEKATMPVQTAEAKAELVNLTQLPQLKLDLRYATAQNCFSEPLYTEYKAYLNKDAVNALAKVTERLADYGYGLVVWDAYRPWKVTKLAHDALTEDYKKILPSGEEGSIHNTGNAVDLSLYNLETGELVDMISDFDEPSPRQYGSFAGGTSLQRWQRNLLQQIMSVHGFTPSEMEWWHFDYLADTKYQLLDIPFNELP
ncbi:MAG TPA: hypothetical protein IAB06_05165 [Candidatus Avacidaminococcus intestinavium]|uniref:D-alanyl-D-alanine dipeptidase n=1 Tax=Candidatus Avacidaminococcus intestinavium TaxID=2840684 RepID=A0A9D1SLV0_9FIRM|nr:hypothetical protein [Candidatus Avacidaminococcus intestinavium]